jgi:uncharacterized protein
MDKIEYKSVATEFKAAGDQGVYEGHFSIFGNVDDGGDMMHAGAFAKTIAERGKRVKVFYAHDWSKLIGPPPDLLEEDARGLHVKGRLTLASFWGREAWELMKDSALTEASIGYEPVKWDYQAPDGAQISEQDAWATRGVVRNLREVKLYEVSPVPLGMNGLADVEAIKAALLTRSPHGHSLKEEPLETYLTTLGMIAAQLKGGRVLSAGNKEKVQGAVSALESALEALNALLAAADPDAGKALQSTLLRRARVAEYALTMALRN